MYQNLGLLISKFFKKGITLVMKASDCKTSQVSEDRVYDPREEPGKCLVLC